MSYKNFFTGVLLAGALLIPASAASATEPNPDSAGHSVAAEISGGDVLVLTPEEMKADGVGSPEEYERQLEALASLTDEQRGSQAELREEIDAGLAAAGISRGEPADLVSSVATDDGVISPYIWRPACWTSGDYYQVGTVSGTHCFANAGSISFNKTFAWDNDLVSVRPGNNRGYVLYQYNGVYYNSLTRGPDYNTYYFGDDPGTGQWFFGVTIF